MADKLLVVIVSDDVKASVGARMAARMAQRGTLEDVRVLFFGPSERLLADPPPDLAESLATLRRHARPLACQAVAQQLGVASRLLEVDTELVPAGEEVERRLRDGYEIMTF
jgi:hypothetical protein